MISSKLTEMDRFCLDNKASLCVKRWSYN
uniref:Uncharacterized protein n=1 Tax=Rhizophora mucronata TaxID=61149 RepID=A0A2P2NSB3_RHIMU